jgi:hypothetical protein
MVLTLETGPRRPMSGNCSEQQRRTRKMDACSSSITSVALEGNATRLLSDTVADLFSVDFAMGQELLNAAEYVIQGERLLSGQV